MQAIRFLFSFGGRISRVDFWILVVTIVSIVTAAFVVDRIFMVGVLTDALSIIVFAIIVPVFLSAMARRLHDRNKSAWYILLFVGVPTVLQQFLGGGDTFQIIFISGGTTSFLDFICLAISTWMIVELGFLPGSQGDNTYGPSPLVSETAAG